MTHGPAAQHAVTVLLVAEDRRIGRAMWLLLTAIPDLRGVEMVKNAEAALARAAALPTGVAVVDVLPSDVPAGLTLVRALAATEWAVLAMSAQGSLAQRALDNGASAFVDQGADPDEIVGLVRHLAAQAPRERTINATGTPD